MTYETELKLRELCDKAENLCCDSCELFGIIKKDIRSFTLLSINENAVLNGYNTETRIAVMTILCNFLNVNASEIPVNNRKNSVLLSQISMHKKILSIVKKIMDNKIEDANEELRSFSIKIE